MKCKPTCAYRLSPTGLSRLMETFEDRTERIDAAAMALDLLIANIDTEKSFCMDAACKDIKESRERMGRYIRMAYVAAYSVRREGCRAERRLFWLLAMPRAPRLGGDQSANR